jgi:thioredoxin 1
VPTEPIEIDDLSQDSMSDNIMKSKNVLKFVLLGFVAVSVATMAWREVRTARVATSGPRGLADQTATGPKLIAYYLHGKIRCATCNDIEVSAKRVVESSFADELKDGRIEWRALNYEEPGNEHFATDFKLAAPCVVLATMRDGQRVAWKSLPEVWGLIGDKPAFRAFVQKSIRDELGESPRTEVAAAGPPTVKTLDASLPSLAAETRNLPRLLDLGSTRCVPCKRMAPILEELRGTYRDTLEVVFIDLFEDSTAAEKYGVSIIPTQVFFDASGNELFRHEGFFSREEILLKWRELGVELDARDEAHPPGGGPS